MKCPYCNKEHDDSAKFCHETGMPLTQTCPNPDCGRTGLPLSAKFCPSCGFNLETNNRNTFRICDIEIGKTTLLDLQDSLSDSDLEITDSHEENGQYKEFELKLDENICLSFAAISMEAPIVAIAGPLEKTVWGDLFPIPDILSIDAFVRNLHRHNWRCKKMKVSWDNSQEVVFFFEERNWLGVASFPGNTSEVSKVEVKIVYRVPCPNCGEQNKLQIEEKGKILCKSCKNEYYFYEAIEQLEYCPNCGWLEFTDDGSGHLQYQCSNCGHIWGD